MVKVVDKIRIIDFVRDKDDTNPVKAIKNLRGWTRIRNGLAYQVLLKQKGTPKKLRSV